ncbi:Kinesin-like protein KIN-14N [Cucumispora dikerogammari]|nr:Kinesin-like protein KIN-14N [Cucumispora dikerogammari]
MKRDPLGRKFDEINSLYKYVERQINKQDEVNEKINKNQKLNLISDISKNDAENKHNHKNNQPLSVNNCPKKNVKNENINDDDPFKSTIDEKINDLSLSFVYDSNKKLKYKIDEKIFDDFIKSRIVQNKEKEIDIMKNTLKQKNKIINNQKMEISEYEVQIDEFTELLKGIRDMFSDKEDTNILEILEKINMNVQTIKDGKSQDNEKDQVICELQEHLIRQKLEIENIKGLDHGYDKNKNDTLDKDDIMKMEVTLKEKDETISILKANLESRNSEYRDLLTSYEKLNTKHMNQQKKAEHNKFQTISTDTINKLNEDVVQLQSENVKLNAENVVLKQKIEKINSINNENTDQIKKLTAENEDISEKLTTKTREFRVLKSEIENLKIHNFSQEKEIDALKIENSELLSDNKGNCLRESLLKERILDLQGNIRVFLRIRQSKNNQKSVSYKVKNNLLSINNQNFNFDWVYSKSTPQKEVFNELNFLIKSAFNGCSIIISCYGQTGSGKTYTMEGKTINNICSTDINEEAGIFPRSIHSIFESISEMRELGYNIDINFSAVEIYNDKTNFFVDSNDFRKNHKNLEIIYDTVRSKEEIFLKYQHCISKRKIAETDCNKTSSRSHFIIFLQFLVQKDGETLTGQIAFIDLAGSERISRSSVKGDRLKETTCINTSLLGFRNVLYALKVKEDSNTFIPYRSCTLTHLLKPFFEHKIRMVMIVNVSDLEEDLNETICSLRFGEMSREVKFGRAERQIELLKDEQNI